jgi:DNA-directed RNA polymerase
MCRSLLLFRDAKPLGPSGLRWMKIQLANLFGVDKCSFDDREAFIDAHLEEVRESARDPLGESDRWWMRAEKPFLALSVCFELSRALSSPDPSLYESRLPIHQDGSCNGLQHYAALGRDAIGGEAVNLTPAEIPQDVYMDVADRVIQQIAKDAAMEVSVSPMWSDVDFPLHYQTTDLKALRKSLRKLRGGGEKSVEEQRVEAALSYESSYVARHRKIASARLLSGKITRKIVKQTVMTSVYGVTFIGARQQILARLKEIFDDPDDPDLYPAACYAADITIGSMDDLFTSARGIMEWLGKVANEVAIAGQPMSWITPLGLPVCQPYRKNGKQQVRTRLQHIVLQRTEFLNVSAGRQKSAFPPNFVHSIDSTHMLMTAERMREEGLTFASVHDSYWTHACDVPRMNRILREEFVELYSQPLLEDLLEELKRRFPETKFPELPPRGDLDLNEVLESQYFFN